MKQYRIVFYENGVPSLYGKWSKLGNMSVADLVKNLTAIKGIEYEIQWKEV